MVRVLLTLIIIGLAVYALADIAGADRAETGGLPKWVWAVVVVILPVAGPLGWIVFRRASATAPGRPTSGGSTTQRRAPLAPDDDPEFLRRLDEQRRRDHDDPKSPPAP
jgi:hypothetical protein